MSPESNSSQCSDEHPRVDVVVCVYNEADYIEEKLEDLASLAYPRERLNVIVVDGGSNDDTPERVRRWSGCRRLAVDLVCTPASGKPAQLNAGLGRCSADWVLVTDADARLPASTLSCMLERASADPRIAVVGTAIRPSSGHPLDHAHWTVANLLLRLESLVGSAGLVVGPCYLVRRTFCTPLPADTIADDVRVSCRVLLAGARIACADIIVTELRTPVGGQELFRHKVRKARAYMHEVRASLPLLRGVDLIPLAVFLGRAALLLTIPFTFVGVLLAVGAFVGTVYGAAAGLSAVAIGVASLRGRPHRPSPAGWLRICVGLPIVTSAVLLAAICMRPFTAISPRYPRIHLVDRARDS